MEFLRRIFAQFTTKITVAVIVLAVAPVFGLGWILAQRNLFTLKELSRDLYIATAQTVVNELENLTDNTHKHLAQIAQILNTQALDEQTAIQLISGEFDKNSPIHAVGLYTLQGQFIDAVTWGDKRSTGLPASLPANVPDRILRAFDTTEHCVLVQRSASNGTNTAPLLIARKQTQVGRFQGILLAAVEQDDLNALVNTISRRTFGGERGAVYVVSNTLTMIAFDKSTAVQFQRANTDASINLQGQGVFSVVASTQEIFSSRAVGISHEYTNLAQTPMLGTYLISSTLSLAVVVEQPQQIAYQSVYEMRRQVLLWSVISGVLALFFSIAITRALTRPLRKLVSAAENLRAQDFSRRLPAQRSDEFGVVFHAFNEASHELEHYQRLNVHNLLAERNKFEITMRQIGTAALMLTPTKTVMIASDKFGTMFSKDALTLEGKNIHDIGIDAEIVRIVDEAFLSGEAFVLQTLTIKRVGEIRETVLRVAIHRIILEDELIAVLVSCIDVTKEVEIDRMKTELVAIVAHELRSPLVSIRGFSDLIAMGYVNTLEEAIDFNTRISAQTEKLEKVINKFLDISRMESGKSEVRRIPFLLHDTVLSVMSVNSMLAEQKNMRFETRIPDKTTPIIGDPDLIGQVVLNFISNAVKYSDPNKTIRVVLDERETEMYVAVQDQGYGISESAQKKMFGKFFRATDDERVSQHIGTGLGLAFVKEIIEQHGGHIGLESQLNVGSTFWFTLPK